MVPFNFALSIVKMIEDEVHYMFQCIKWSNNVILSIFLMNMSAYSESKSPPTHWPERLSIIHTETKFWIIGSVFLFSNSYHRVWILKCLNIVIFNKYSKLTTRWTDSMPGSAALIRFAEALLYHQALRKLKHFQKKRGL